MQPTQITEESAVDAACGAPLFLLVKHSLVCPISARGFGEYEAFLEAHPDTPTGWIDVIGSRPLSLLTAERTGVKHESPQALVLKEGKAVWHASHLAITRDALAQAVDDARD